MQAVNLRSFKQRVRHNRRRFRMFLASLERNTPKNIQEIAAIADTRAWAETDCLSCANCCKTMTPTFTPADIKRIAAHLDMSAKAFKDKWLHKDKKDNDWVNVKQPCQFLDLTDNKCSIYEVRPADCSGFPHHSKKKMTDYIHVYKQNVELCPATYKWTEKLMELVKADQVKI